MIFTPHHRNPPKYYYALSHIAHIIIIIITTIMHIYIMIGMGKGRGGKEQQRGNMNEGRTEEGGF
jgi:hypothetical protein